MSDESPSPISSTTTTSTTTSLPPASLSYTFLCPCYQVSISPLLFHVPDISKSVKLFSSGGYGINIASNWYLFPEEVLYLHSSKRLLVHLINDYSAAADAGELMKMIFGNDVGEGCDLCLFTYLSYAHLRNLGYITLRNASQPSSASSRKNFSWKTINDNNRIRNLGLSSTSSTSSSYTPLLPPSNCTLPPSPLCIMQSSINLALPPKGWTAAPTLAFHCFQPSKSFARSDPDANDKGGFKVCVTSFDFIDNDQTSASVETQGGVGMPETLNLIEQCNSIDGECVRLAAVSDSGSVMVYDITKYDVPDISNLKRKRDVVVKKIPIAPAKPALPSTAIKITSPSGAYAHVLPLGATLQKLCIPTSPNSFTDVVLGYDDEALYASDEFYLGCTVGRVCNRIKGGKLVLPNGFEKTLALNNGENHLHGGTVGWNKKVWSVVKRNQSSVTFEIVSGDGDEGYPGEIRARVSYSMEEKMGSESCARLVIGMSAELLSKGDAMTPINMTNHSYFNLAGAGAGAGAGSIADGCLNHEVQILADHYLPVDGNSIPTREVRALDRLSAVDGSLDFRDKRTIGSCLEQMKAEIINPIDGNTNYGPDHAYVIRGEKIGEIKPAVIMSLGSTTLKIATTQPSLQFYTANYLNNCKGKGKGKEVYKPFDGVCFEPQAYPDSIRGGGGGGGSGGDESGEFYKGACTILEDKEGKRTYAERIEFDVSW